MARMRAAKPSLRTSKVVASWPFEVRYFFVLLWGYLDDEGRGLDIPKAIAGDCFPHDDKITAVTIDKWISVMSRPNPAITDDMGCMKAPPVCRYQVNGTRYIHCLNWKEHQKPTRPTPSKYPPCPLHPVGEVTESFSESPSSRHGRAVESNSDPPLKLHQDPTLREFESLRGRGAASEPLSELPPTPGSGPSTDHPPADRCNDHRDDPDPPAYRRCRDARQHRETWLAANRARIAAEPRCTTHPAEIATNCRSCAGDRKAVA